MYETHDIALPQFQVVASRTVFVAIGNVLEKPLLHLAPATNSQNVMKFLRMIQAARTDKF